MQIEAYDILMYLSDAELLEKLYGFDEFNLMQPTRGRWTASDIQINKLHRLLEKYNCETDNIYCYLFSDDSEGGYVCTLNEFVSFDDYDDFTDITIGIGKPHKRSNMFEVELLSFFSPRG